jgi:hypothetical protein
MKLKAHLAGGLALVFFVIPVRAALPDLTIQDSDIQFPGAFQTSGESFAIQAVVRNAGGTYHDQLHSVPVIQHSVPLDATRTSSRSVAAALWRGQSLIPPSDFYLSAVALRVVDRGAGNDLLRLNIRPSIGGNDPKPDGANNTGVLGTVEADVVNTDGAGDVFEDFYLPFPLQLHAGTTYWLTFESDVLPANSYYVWNETGVPVNQTVTNGGLNTTWTYPASAPTNATASPPTIHFYKAYRPQDTVVRFFNGDPAAGGTLIAVSTVTLPIAAGGSAAVSANASFSTPGVYDIYVQVDGPGLIVESNESNNKASRSVNVIEPQSASAATTIAGADGRTTVSLNPGAVSFDPYFVVLDVSPAATAAVQAASGKPAPSGDPFRQAVPGTLRKVTLYRDNPRQETAPVFSNDVVLTIPYTDDGRGFVAGTNPPVREENLSIYWLNERDNLWVRLPESTVDTAANTVTSRVPHFSYFMVMGMSSKNLSEARAYPVPFSPKKGHTRVKFDGLSSRCTIRVYSASGELVKTIQETDGDGFNDDWDGSGADSGVYLWIADNGDERKTGQLVIVK